MCKRSITLGFKQLGPFILLLKVKIKVEPNPPKEPHTYATTQ